ncbi:hypothetical protein ACFFJB_00785 [Camelimonas abortus]|uniref:Uncharacterized protein n=1 Tax=Camelimonas abortus TaxID=1017184 RepID=A0ABV7LA94_9HYPH
MRQDATEPVITCAADATDLQHVLKNTPAYAESHAEATGRRTNASYNPYSLKIDKKHHNNSFPEKDAGSKLKAGKTGGVW